MTPTHDLTLARLARATLEDRYRRADRRALLRRAPAARSGSPLAAAVARLAALGRRLAPRRTARPAARPCEACS